MKQTLKILTLAATILLVTVSSKVFAQNNIANLRYQNEMWNLWTLEANAGFLSFYGDLSLHDNSYTDKLKFESGPAFSFNLTKHFNRLFAVSGQLLTGRLNGSNTSTSFEADLLEYNLNIKFNIFNLFYPGNSGKYGITAQGGLGQFMFISTKYEYNEGGSVVTQHKSRVPEFVYFMGAGGFLRATDKIGISIDVSLRRCQSDWLDNVVKNNDFDYYTYLSLGLTYYIDRFKKGPIKNRARIAHNNNKFKHLRN